LNILITNDDGVHSPGLWALVEALKKVGDVTVVAPDRDKSGVGASMTLLDVVRIQEIAPHVEGVKAIAVEGTPADCVILATESLVKEKIDLVVSGINQGSNLGLDILTSGTVGGAFQGYFRQIPSIAVSVASLTNLQYEAAAQTAAILARAIFDGVYPSPLLLNVNLPNTSPASISGVEITKLGPRLYLENVSAESNGRRTHYWIRHNKPSGFTPDEDTDVRALRAGKIAITPVDLLHGTSDAVSLYQNLADEVAAGLGIASRV
jgi:5'-nucleotidase